MKPETTLVLIGEEHSGRDEMNLAGNPFALLQAASRSGQSIIHNEWERTLPTGKIVRAVWEVNGHTKLGLPGPNEELLYLVLLQLTRESAGDGVPSSEWPRKVYFSRYDILMRMGWSNRSQHYQELKNAFFRLQAVSIQTEHSFYNPRTGAPFPVIAFSILNDFAIVDEPKGRKGQGNMPLSWFEWNNVLFDSFLAGNVRSLALDFVLSLEFPTSRRLFRLLELFRNSGPHSNREFKIGLMKLRDRLGMTSYRYSSKVKEKLVTAIDELIARKYLREVVYESGKSGELIIFRFGTALDDLNKEMEQGRVEQTNTLTPPVKSPKTKTTPTQLSIVEESPESDKAQRNALKCHALFKTLHESEQAELVELAKKSVNPIWHDRVGNPQSPMSLGLWELVVARYPGRIDLE